LNVFDRSRLGVDVAATPPVLVLERHRSARPAADFVGEGSESFGGSPTAAPVRHRQRHRLDVALATELVGTGVVSA
jgi:hypothetical protein